MEVKRISDTEILFNGDIYRCYLNLKNSMRNYYILQKTINKKQKRKYLHREIWKYHNGEIPKGFVIHHIDHNTENNNIENLQCMSNSEHSKLHSIKKYHKKICVICGKEYNTKEPSFSKYCCRQCQNKARWTKPPIKLKCVICGKIFKGDRYRKPKTCSRKCADKLQWKTRRNI